MIKYSELETIFGASDITLHEYNVELEEDEQISTPFVVYTATNGDSFVADGINYLRLLDVGLALIDETLNFSMQRAIENVLDSNDTTYDKRINFDDNARLYSISYTFSVLDDVGF